MGEPDDPWLLLWQHRLNLVRHAAILHVQQQRSLCPLVRLRLRQALLADQRVHDAPALPSTMRIPRVLEATRGMRKRRRFGEAAFALVGEARTQMQQVLPTAEEGLEL